MYPIQEYNLNFTSNCSILEMKRFLLQLDKDSEYTGLKPKFKCLLPNETSTSIVSRHKYEVPLKQLNNYQLPGFEYSLTYACKKRKKGLSFNCNRNDEKDKCNFVVYCTEHDSCKKEELAIPDGTQCGDNKICLLNDCIHINKLGINEKEYHKMRSIHTCPQGFDNSDVYLNRKVELRLNFNKKTIYNQQSSIKVQDFVNCQTFLQSKKAIQLNITCDGDLFNYVCCEECAKYRIIKSNCGLNGCEKDFCQKNNPCFNNGKCFFNVIRKTFDCICSKGFKGNTFI
jgi:hypothetical protein